MMTTTKNGNHEVLTGTCACCLIRFVTEGQSMVLHGYKRPGHGYIVGNCEGMRFPAYEVSTEGSVYVRNLYLNGARNLRHRAGQIQAGQIREISRTKTVYDGDKNVRRGRLVEVTLTPDSSHEDLRACGYWRWEDVVKAEVNRLQRDADDCDRHAKDFQDAIDAWKPGLEFISEARLNADKRQVQEDRKQARRYAAWGKALGQGIGRAVTEHKERLRQLESFADPQTRSNWERDEDGAARYQERLQKLQAGLVGLEPFPTDKERAAARKRGK